MKVPKITCFYPDFSITNILLQWTSFSLVKTGKEFNSTNQKKAERLRSSVLAADLFADRKNEKTSSMSTQY